MGADAGLLGVAIALTLVAGAGLSAFETEGRRRGWRRRNLGRPGATALIIGVSLAALVTGKLGGNLFVVPAAVFAAVSGMDWLRRGGRPTSFLILWASAILVVFMLDAELPAFGVRWGDVVFSALMLACFASLLRELDVIGSGGWFAALLAAGATTALGYVLDRGDDAGVSLLVTGAVFAVISVSPFGAGLLGRVGSRLAGLVIGALAIRTAVGSPEATIGVVVVGLLCALAFVVTIEQPNRARVALGSLVVGGLLALASVPAVLALLDVYKPIRNAVTTSRGLVRATPEGGLAEAASQLAAVEATFRAADDKLTSPAVLLGQYVPFLGANLRAASKSASVAGNLAASARRLIDDVNVKSVAMRDGQVDRAALDRLERGLRLVRGDVRQARRAMSDPDATELLVPELRDGVEDLARQVASVARRVDTSLDGTRTATRLLGFDRPKRYFVAVQNNAESRATGGYIANYGILEAAGGRVTLPQFRRTAEFDARGAPPRTLNAPLDYKRRYSRFDVSREWTNVNMSPDLPTVARVMADQYAQFSGTKVDGVIAVDPVALAHLLTLTGPVTVPGWPVPITAGNVVPITLHDEYIAFNNRIDDRIDFIGRVAKTVFDRLTTAGLQDLIRAGAALHDATESRHLQVWTTDAASRRFFATVGADGALGRLRGDALMVTTQNAAGNKLDYFLHRDVAYDATVVPEGDRLRVEGTVTVKLRNDGPASGEPRYVIGPFDGRFRAGQNRLFVTVYSPLAVEEATLDGQRLEVDGATEHGRLAHSAFVDVPAGATRTIVLKLSGFVAGADDYRLDVVRQPLTHNDTLSLRVSGVGAGELRQTGTFRRDLHLITPVSRS